MKSTLCAICGTYGEAHVVYEANFKPVDVNPATFSARRLPDRIHYRMVSCVRCGLLRSDPVLEEHELKALYEKSVVTYESDYPGLIHTYTDAVREALKIRPLSNAILEIGCGDGFFLKEAIRIGFTEIKGVEPSFQAIERADNAVQASIVQGLYKKELFAPATFDLACLFQVIDHLPDPNESLDALFYHLKPKGLILTISHDMGAMTNRLLKDRSPVIDIEHTYLFDKKTLSALLEKHGFETIAFHACKNTHTLRHWCELMPLPRGIKIPLLKIIAGIKMSELPIRLTAGNFICIAQKKS